MVSFTDPKLSDNAAAAIEMAFGNDKEAHELLKLIDTEFRSDPMSVQCFDLRIVERVRECVETRKGLSKHWLRG